MKVHFNTKINYIETYSPMDYNRSPNNLYIKNLINDCYKYESIIARIINCKSQYIILTNYDGEYEIKVRNFTKEWHEDESVVNLYRLLQQFQRIDEFIRLLDYNVDNQLQNDGVSRIEFKFYALHIIIDNICYLD